MSEKQLSKPDINNSKGSFSMHLQFLQVKQTVAQHERTVTSQWSYLVSLLLYWAWISDLLTLWNKQHSLIWCLRISGKRHTPKPQVTDILQLQFLFTFPLKSTQHKKCCLCFSEICMGFWKLKCICPIITTKYDHGEHFINKIKTDLYTVVSI